MVEYIITLGRKTTYKNIKGDVIESLVGVGFNCAASQPIRDENGCTVLGGQNGRWRRGSSGRGSDQSHESEGFVRLG